jgi:hypothetical protein
MVSVSSIGLITSHYLLQLLLRWRDDHHALDPILGVMHDRVGTQRVGRVGLLRLEPLQGRLLDTCISKHHHPVEFASGRRLKIHIVCAIVIDLYIAQPE